MNSLTIPMFEVMRVFYCFSASLMMYMLSVWFLTMASVLLRVILYFISVECLGATDCWFSSLAAVMCSETLVALMVNVHCTT